MITYIRWFRDHTRFSPIGLSMLGVAISLVGDLVWLIWECFIETNKFSEHPVIYGTVLTCLVWGIILGWYGLKRYIDSGLESHERKLVIKHHHEKKCSERLGKICK